MKAVEGPHVRCLFGLKRVHRRQAARVVVAQATRLHADVLVLDATNILSRASSDARRLSHVPIGYSLKACFRDWVTYLVAAASPQVLIAIFDNPVSKCLLWSLFNAKHINKNGSTSDRLRNRCGKRGIPII